MNVDSEEQVLAGRLWAACNQMRGKMDAAQYRILIIPLIWLKYISESFEHQRKNPKNPDSEGIEFQEGGRFWVPEDARWDYIVNSNIT